MKTEANVEKRSLEEAQRLHKKLCDARLVLQSAACMFATAINTPNSQQAPYDAALEQAAHDFSKAYWDYDG